MNKTWNKNGKPVTYLKSNQNFVFLYDLTIRNCINTFTYIKLYYITQNSVYTQLTNKILYNIISQSKKALYQQNSNQPNPTFFL